MILFNCEDEAMGRALEFSQDEALSKAMFIFWEKGYENTSLKELLETMGIQNGSFYNTYRNKRQVFIQAMKFYERDFSLKRSALFQNPKTDFKKKMRILFKHTLDRQKESVCPKGCFLFNSVTAEVLGDVELFKLVRKGVENFEEFLVAEIAQSIQKKEIGASVDPRLTASLIVTYIQGLMKLSMLDYSDAKFREQTEYFLVSLGV